MKRQWAADFNENYSLVSRLFFEAADLFLMYEFITDTEKREAAKKLVNNRLDGIIEIFEVEINSINSHLALQEHPAIIGIMMRMKDELRLGQELLKSAAIK